ncbi:lyase family protein [Amycolatopsis suaedae]|uniref:3-carboxy-cis,cis-muconate cycloisomerase n=1 Tax=Amycolatopsis suaedae TaxID=2510978 RepID=A0A4Q7IZF8_9PSEU|nr:lyase family protein [Amycolatopsis suaedae]RZQ59486.1 3-carboxy-cis,cis-muconate cycloisomerase [Amycolatopsis suaedae]
MAQAGDGGLLAPAWAATGVDALADDAAWVRAMLSVEAALARAQARLGVVPAEAAAVITRVAGDVLPPDLADGVRATGNPVVALVAGLTAAVRERDPAAAEHVHRGATSQDILDTAAMLVAARVLRQVRADLDATAAALAGLAERHRDTPMAGRTLTQHAVPVTFGLRAAGWLRLVLDATDRVDRLLDGGLPVSLGGAAGTLAGYQEQARLAGAGGASGLPGAVAAELGLAEPVLPWHGLRTPVADLAAVLAFTGGALGKIAADVQVLSRTEIGEVAEETAPGRGASSAMPQKRNPVYATLVATAARQIPAQTLVLWQSMPAEDERSAGAWHAEWQPLREALRLTGGAAANAERLCAGLRVFPDRMRANLGLTGAAVVSERISAVLAPVVGRQAAKRLLAEAVAAEGDRAFPEVLAELAARDGHRIDAGWIATLLDPAAYLGQAGDLVDRVLDSYHKRGTARV